MIYGTDVFSNGFFSFFNGSHMSMVVFVCEKDLEAFRYFQIQVKDIANYDPENLPYSNHYLILIISTYLEGRSL